MAENDAIPTKIAESEDTIGALGIAGRSDYEQLNAWPRKRWHALGANLYPSEQELFEGDLGELIREHVITRAGRRRSRCSGSTTPSTRSAPASHASCSAT